MHECGTWLPGFFRHLANAWRGFDDAKSFGSLEGELTIDARHDGLGTVFCEVTIRQPWPPDWSLTATLDFGAGAHLQAIADEIDVLLG